MNETGRKIAIYGLGENYKKYKMLFTNERCMEGVVVAYSDKSIKDVEPYISPEKLCLIDVDVIVVTCSRYREVLDELDDNRAVYFLDYFREVWGVDRRAVKFLDAIFLQDLADVKRLGRINSFVEIGANFAQDAVLVQRVFDIDDDDIYVFEPHPDIMKSIKGKHGYHYFEKAVSDYSGKSSFKVCNIDCTANNGMSSLRNSRELYDDSYNLVDVDVIRIDELIEACILPQTLDFVKIDVEGNVYEALRGFGKYIRNIRVIQCEGDYHAFWEGEKLFDEIFNYLWVSGFRMVNFHITDDYRETDSLWINNSIMPNC